MSDDHRDQAAERVFERVRSGSWRADVDAAATRQRRRRVQFGTAMLIVVAVAGLVAVAGRSTDDVSEVASPSATVGTTTGPDNSAVPSATPPEPTHVHLNSTVPSATSLPTSVLTASNDPCRADTTPPAPTAVPTTTSGGDVIGSVADETAPADRPCGWLASELNALLGIDCADDQHSHAVDVTSDLLQTYGLGDTWSIVEGSTGEACTSVAILDVERRQITVVGSATCTASTTPPPTTAIVTVPTAAGADANDVAADCLELAAVLRAEVNAQCLTTDDAVATVRDRLERAGPGWEITVAETTLCAMAWTDATARTVTIGDTQP